ncbi:MAG TPA: nuclear transport factor 2 family protein [Kofleriaceae bacterium]|nr:nuclear transport factor 2 family protein [Kofleriaceae bacterium]
MPAASERPEVAAVRDVVARLTAAWRGERFEQIPDLLHEDVVFESPGLASRVVGRAACADSYRQFMSAATVLEYVEHSLSIETWGATAVATTHCEMAWEMDGQSQRESVHDVLVLAERAGRWQVVWRTLVPIAPAAPPA